MQMLDGLKRFRAEVLRVVPELGQRGVDPRKHARSRPMRLNIRWFGHGVPCPAFKECTLETRLRKLRFQKWAWMVVARRRLLRLQSFHYEVAQAVRIAV